MRFSSSKSHHGIIHSLPDNSHSFPDNGFCIPGKGLKLYHINACSLLPKLDELKCSHGIINQEAALLAISESHRSSRIQNSELQIDGYQLFRRDRLVKSGGGVAAYVLNKYVCINRVDFQLNNAESLWLEINQGGTLPLLVCILYRPPDSPINWYENFEAEIHKASSYSHNIIILGDLNIDLLKTIPSRWTSILNSYNLTQIINQPTRITSASSTLIDHIYVSRLEFVHYSSVLNITLSNHLGIGLCWKQSVKPCSQTNHTTVKYRKKVPGNGIVIQQSLSSALEQVSQVTDVDDQIYLFNDALHNFEKSTSKLVTQRVWKPAQPKRFNNHILAAIKLRNSFKASKKFELYRHQRNLVTNMIKYEKSHFYRNMLIQAKGNTRKLWSCLNEVIGKPSSSIPRVLNTDSGLLTDALEVANFLNTYFINIASQVTAHLPPSTDYTPSMQFNDFLFSRLSGKPKFSLPHISVDTTLSYLNNLKVKKSAGLDNIRVSLLKMASPNLILPLCNIINTSITHGFYPSLRKSAKVFALHKSWFFF